MRKTTFYDFEKNHICKTNRWLGFALSFMIFLIGQLGFAQLTYQIGSGTSTTSYFPIYYNYDYNYSQVIYTAAELNAQGAVIGGQITKIRYKPTSSVSTTYWKDWVIYMGNTTKTDFSSTSDWVAVSSMSQVFNGQIVANTTANNWIEITLSTPFTWDGTSNIVVAVDENTAGYGNSTSWAGYTLAPASGNKGLYKYQDTTNIDPLSPPTGTRTNTVAQIQFVGDLTPLCTGQVSAGVASASVTNACASVPFTVSLTGATMAGSVTYQWQSSPAGAGTFTDISGATCISYTIANQTVATDYRCVVVCLNSNTTDISNVVSVAQNAITQCYCTPTYSYACSNTSENINSFILTGEGTSVINDLNTGCSSTGNYEDRTSLF